ncbi:hypothetical protein KY290_004893 [Solanum tuberosum]|uniref:Reverse transcriptase zinc-binding domain-containing protein n=1 Tax=Solanum tuberosum TaxID=4113 RepID=A0ABQ7WCI1_SOLTU|nr:hypothetical protein KY290_004893 [Solanum tuberosum]
MVKKIIQAGHWISEAGLPMTEIMDAYDFIIKSMYKKLRGDFIKVPWRRLTCNNQGNPKWIFILYLTIHRRLYTMDKLDKWGIHTDQVCVLCKQELETRQHLFFSCTMAARIWHKLLQWLCIIRNTTGWIEEMDWAISHATGKAIQDEVYMMTLAATVYYVWQERNYRIFQKKERTTEMITRSIIQEIHCRSSMQPKLAEFIRNFNYYP